MPTTAQPRSATRWIRSVAVPLVILSALLAGPAPTVAAAPAAAHQNRVIVLPDAQSAEGIAKGRGSTFYAGELFTGDIFRGNVRRGTAAKFIDAPDGRAALGMAFDRRHDLLFVAGGPTGQGYIYDTRSRTTVASYQFGDSGSSLINDVTLTDRGAWFTDSMKPQLYFVPLSKKGKPAATFKTLQLSGPAARLTGQFNLNGIRATDRGRILIVAHTANGALYTVNPKTGASAPISGISVPNVDGIELAGKRLWAVQNASNQITRIRLNKDVTAGTVTKVITSKNFESPTTAAKFGNKLAVVQAKFNTGFPPTADTYEVVVVRA
jgi:sugar lactone lactonase YvrE